MDGKVRSITGLFCVKCGCMVDNRPFDSMKMCVCSRCDVYHLTPDERRALHYVEGRDKLPVIVTLRIANKYLTGETSKGYSERNAARKKLRRFNMSYSEVKRQL